MALLVKDVMAKQLIKIDSGKSVREAGELLRKTRRDALVVVDKGKAIGIITDSDLIKKVVAKNLQPSKLTVKKVMSSPLVTVKSSETVLDATRRMKKGNIKRLVVVDDGNLVGIIDFSDVARNSPEMIDLLEYKLKMKEEEPAIRELTTSGICENCSNYSSDLRYDGGQWICEDCRTELEE